MQGLAYDAGSDLGGNTALEGGGCGGGRDIWSVVRAVRVLVCRYDLVAGDEPMASVESESERSD